jgi:hypothetical protein
MSRTTVRAHKRLIDRIDPIYLLVRAICYRFFRASLAEWERDFLLTNISKHRAVLWFAVLATAPLALALRDADPSTIPTIITALIAPAMVTGGAWFAISFGGIPARFLDVAIQVTFWMLTAFTLSLHTMVIATMFIAPAIIWPVLLIIEFGVLAACILYDNADGLKIGLDEAVLRHSRAAIVFYRKQGIDVAEIEETEEK